MSETVYAGQELMVGCYTAAASIAGEGRRRWQFTCRMGQSAGVLTDSQLAELVAGLLVMPDVARLVVATFEELRGRRRPA